MSVEPARVRQQPDACAADLLVLQSELCISFIKRRPESSHTKDRKNLWLVFFDLLDDHLSAVNIFAGRKLIGSCCGAFYETCDADPIFQQLVLFGRVELPVSKSAKMQCFPEPVSGTGE